MAINNPPITEQQRKARDVKSLNQKNPTTEDNALACIPQKTGKSVVQAVCVYFRVQVIYVGSDMRGRT